MPNTPNLSKAFVSSSIKKRKKPKVSAPPKVEVKFHDQFINDEIVSTAEVQAPLLTIAQGTTESQRIGRKITITSIHMYGVFELKQTNDFRFTAEIIRVIIFQDKQANGALPGILDLMENGDLISFRNLSNSGRFIFHHDEFYNVSTGGGAGNAGSGIEFARALAPVIEFHKDVRIPIEYDNSLTTGVVTSIRSNNIGLLLMSGDTTHGKFESRFRFRFVDD